MGGLDRAVHSKGRSRQVVTGEDVVPLGIQNRQQRRKLNTIGRRALAYGRKIGAFD